MRGGELDRHLCSCCLSPWPLVSLPSTRWAPLINILISSDARLCQSVSPPLVFSLARHDRRLKLCGSPPRPSPGLQPKDAPAMPSTPPSARARPAPFSPLIRARRGRRHHCRPGRAQCRQRSCPSVHSQAPVTTQRPRQRFHPADRPPKPKSLQPAPRSTFTSC
jgi:hypothetical protein